MQIKHEITPELISELFAARWTFLDANKKTYHPTAEEISLATGVIASFPQQAIAAFFFGNTRMIVDHSRKDGKTAGEQSSALVFAYPAAHKRDDNTMGFRKENRTQDILAHELVHEVFEMLQYHPANRLPETSKAPSAYASAKSVAVGALKERHQYVLNLPDSIRSAIDSTCRKLLSSSFFHSPHGPNDKYLGARLNLANDYYGENYVMHPGRGYKSVPIEAICNAFAFRHAYDNDGRGIKPDSVKGKFYAEIYDFLAELGAMRLEREQLPDARESGMISRITILPGYIAWIDPQTAQLAYAATTEPWEALDELTSQKILSLHANTDIQIPHAIFEARHLDRALLVSEALKPVRLDVGVPADGIGNLRALNSSPYFTLATAGVFYDYSIPASALHIQKSCIQHLELKLGAAWEEIREQCGAIHPRIKTASRSESPSR